MDYQVVTETLRQHGRESGQRAGAVASILGSVRLDVASSAMAGGMAASMSRTLQGRFDPAARALREGLDAYAEGITDTARNYTEQEERAADAISSFFGR